MEACKLMPFQVANEQSLNLEFEQVVVVHYRHSCPRLLTGLRTVGF